MAAPTPPGHLLILINLDPCDVLVLYTDGITETQNASDEFFEENRLHKSIAANDPCSAVQIRDNLVSDVQDCMNDEPLYDDIGLIVLRRDGG